MADRYTIVGELGTGGMGTVYLAEHQHMRKRVALKVLHPDMANVEEVARRFEREAIASAHITHPNVAAALDFIRTGDGTCLLVLEYAEGDTLRDIVSKGPLPSGGAIRVAHDIALALEAAHDKGIVHRDLKPENVVVQFDSAGQPVSVKVLDFGVAKMDVQGLGAGHTGDQPLTRMGAVLGTPDYMAPEQAMGDRVDHRADFYALGMMLAEMLTGKRPFRGGAMTVLRQRVLGDPLEATDLLGTGTDPELLELLRKLLATAPGDRPGRAPEVVQALESLMRRDVPVEVPAFATSDGKDSTSGTAATALASPTARDDFYDRTTVAIAPGRESTSPVAAPPHPPLQRQSQRRAPWGFIAFVAVMAIGIGGAAAIFLMSRWKSEEASKQQRQNAQRDAGASTAPVQEPVPSARADDDALEFDDDDEAADAAAPEKTTTKPKPASKPRSSHKRKSSAASKPKRRTGPGGIYIPPPKNWF